jgi:acyl carrier protein
MNQADVAERIEHYVRTQFRVSAKDQRFSRSLPLFEAGYVDSVGVVELLNFIEEHFAVNLPDEILMSDEFSTIDGIATAICRYREAGPAGETGAQLAGARSTVVGEVFASGLGQGNQPPDASS